MEKQADTQGHSAPQAQLYDYFGFAPSDMASAIDKWANTWKTAKRMPGLGEFEELLLGHVQH